MYMDNYSPSHPTGEMESENECNNETNEVEDDPNQILKFQKERDILEGVFKGIVSQMAETTKNENDDENKQIQSVEKKSKNDLSDKYIMLGEENQREMSRSRSNICSDQQSRSRNISGISDSEISKSSKQSFSVRNDRNHRYILKRIRSRSKSVSDEDSIVLKDNYQKSKKMQPKRIFESYNKELKSTSENNCRNDSSKIFPQKFKDSDIISNKLTLLKSNKVWEFSSDEESNSKDCQSNRKIHQNFDRQSSSKRKSYSMDTHSFRDNYDLGFVNKNVRDNGERDKKINENDCMTYIFNKYSEAFDVDEDFALSDEIDKIIRSPIMQTKRRGPLKGFESDSDWGKKLNEFQRIAKYISLEELPSNALESNYTDFDFEQCIRDKVYEKDMIYNPRVNNIGMDANEEIVPILNKHSKTCNYDKFVFDDRRDVDIRTLSRQDKQNEYSFKRFQNDFLLRQQDNDYFNQRNTKSITLEQKRQYPVGIYDRTNLELERYIKEKYGSLNVRNDVKGIIGINVNERESSIVNRHYETLMPNADCQFWKTKCDDNEILIKQDENIQLSLDRFHSEFQWEQNFDKFNQRNIKSYTQKLYKSETWNYNRTNSGFERHINEKFDDRNIEENMIGKDINERMTSVHNSSKVREADEEFSYRRNYNNEISMIQDKYNKDSPERFQNNFEWEQNIDSNFNQRIVRNITREQEWDLPMSKTLEYGLTNFERNINENFSDRNKGDGIFNMNVDERISYIPNRTLEPREMNEKLILWNMKYNDNESSIIQDENTKWEISDQKINENKLRQKSSVQPNLAENFESDFVDMKKVQNIELSNSSENYLNESHKELYNLELGSKVSVKYPIANDNKLEDLLLKVDVKSYDNVRVWGREGSMTSSIKVNDYINQTNESNMSYQPGHRPTFQNKNNSSNIDFEQKFNDPRNISNNTLQNPLIKDKCFNSYQDNFSENDVNYYDVTILPQKSNFEGRKDARDIKVSNMSETISNNFEDESYKGLSNCEKLSKESENSSIVNSNNLNEFITNVTVGNLDNQFDALVSKGNISSSWKENDLPVEINKVNLLYQSEEPLLLQNRDYYYNFSNNNFSNNINFEKGYNNTTDFNINIFQRPQMQDQSFNNYQNNTLSGNYDVNYNNESLYLNNFIPQQVRPPYTYNHNNFMPSQQMPNIVFPTRVCGQLPFPLNTSIRPPIPMIPQLQHPTMSHMMFIPPPPPTEDPLPPQPPAPSAEEAETIINEEEKYVEQLPNISQPLNNIAQSLSMMDNKNLLETLLTKAGLSGDKLRLAQEKKQDLSSRLDGDTFSNIVKSAATSVISRLVESSVKAPPISDNMSMSPPSPPSSSPFQESSNDLNIKQSEFVTPPLSNSSDSLKPLHMSSHLEDVSDNEKNMLRSYFECKNDWQERIALEVKTFLKPSFLSKTINKNDYKEIMKRCVTKITRSGVTQINKNKIEKFVLSYVNKYNRIHNTKQSVAVSSSERDS